MRLIRKDNQFTAQNSSYGVQWVGIGDYGNPNNPSSIEILMNETVYIYLAISSHNTSCTAEARISNVRLTGSVTPSGPFTLLQDISFQTLSESNN